MAEPLPNEDQDPAAGFHMSRSGASMMAALALAESALQPLIEAYTETGATLTPSAGAVTIPLDGKVYKMTLTANVTSVSTTPPTSPECGIATVYIKQDGTGGWTFAIPATWQWPNKVAVPISSAANAKDQLVLSNDPDGSIIATLTRNIGAPA